MVWYGRDSDASPKKKETPTMATEDGAKAIEAATHALLTATVTADADGYAQLVSDNLLYVHSTGDHDNKESVLEKVGAGQYGAVAKIEYEPTNIWVIGDIGLAIGTLTPVLKEGASFPARPVSAVDVWQHRDDRWQLLVHHLTPIPQPA
jgi:ketosteroid isomerase-like protein